MIHDAQYDYYGKRLATCSSDKVIKIFDVVNNNINPVADLIGHEGPVWAVSWAHPKFGIKLASASYDRTVIVWSCEEASATHARTTGSVGPHWVKSYVYSGCELSVNSLAWAPHELGLVLCCGSSDGTVSVLTQNGANDWSSVRFVAHKGGVSAVSWSPSSSQPVGLGALAGGSGLELGSVNNSNQPTISSGSHASTPRFVSAGFDNMIRVWSLEHASSRWTEEATLEGHTDWVRDVAWSPNVGLPYSTIASCSQDGSVLIWSQYNNGQSSNHNGASAWVKYEIKDERFAGAALWRVSWSVTGNLLAVSSGESTVTLWKESLDHEWQCISAEDQQQLQQQGQQQ